MGWLTGKNVVITGASSGIGKEMAYEIAAHGGRPILLARRAPLIEEIAADICENFSIEALAFVLDVADESAVVKVFERIKEAVGFVDVLINNAGFALFKSVGETTYEESVSMMQVNVVGLMTCTAVVLKEMMKENRGHIINVASIIGKIPTPKATTYAATKHAVLGYTNGLRMELSKTNICVSAVNPGPIRTEFFDLADTSGNYKKNIEKMMLDPTVVAKRTVGLIKTGKRELNLPWWMGIGGKFYAVAPVLMERTLGERLFQK